MPTRRALLRAAAATPAAVGATPKSLRGQRPVRDGPTVNVAVHRAPSVGDGTLQRVVRAVEVGVEQVARAANATLDVDVDRAVATGETAARRRIATDTRAAVFESGRDWLADADALSMDAVHLLLVDSPLEPSIGYGGNRTHLFDGGPVSYANVGATDQWDDRAVTANIAVHEVLHALVTPHEVEAVVGGRCEHDLGAIHAAPDGGAIVTPFATAYADDAIGGETQWAGSGCSGGFSTNVGYDPDWWGHTYALSRATLAATTRYLERA